MELGDVGFPNLGSVVEEWGGLPSCTHRDVWLYPIPGVLDSDHPFSGVLFHDHPTCVIKKAYYSCQ